MPGLISLKSLAPVPRGRRAAACGTGQATAWKNDGKSRESTTAQENAGIQSLGDVMKAATRASAQLASMAVFRASAALVRLPEAAAASGGTTTTAVLLAEARAVTTTMTTTRGGKASEVKTYYSSSGSEHEPNSVCLAAMVHEFMEEDEEGADERLVGKCGRARCNCGIGSCSATNSHGEDENDDPVPKPGGEMREIFQVNLFVKEFSQAPSPRMCHPRFLSVCVSVSLSLCLSLMGFFPRDSSCCRVWCHAKLAWRQAYWERFSRQSRV